MGTSKGVKIEVTEYIDRTGRPRYNVFYNSVPAMRETGDRALALAYARQLHHSHRGASQLVLHINDTGISTVLDVKTS